MRIRSRVIIACSLPLIGVLATAIATANGKCCKKHGGCPGFNCTAMQLKVNGVLQTRYVRVMTPAEGWYCMTGNESDLCEDGNFAVCNAGKVYLNAETCAADGLKLGVYDLRKKSCGGSLITRTNCDTGVILNPPQVTHDDVHYITK